MRPFRDLNFASGLFTLLTDRGAGALKRWRDGNKVRFHKGLAQKIGGWLKSGSTTFTGKCRGLTDWLSLTFEKFIGLGTHLKLYVWKGGVYYDITPIRASSTINNNPFSMTNTSTTVTVTDTAHGALAGDYVTFSGAAAAGGITIDGEYAIATYVDANSYTITHSAAATSTTTGGGAVVVAAYQISVGAVDSLYGLGWGAGPYGGSTYGTARTVSNFLTAARTWSLDQWGEDLIACPRGGGIYVWDASTGTGTRAVVISAAPATAKAILVSPENKHLVALGAYNGSADDPMLIKWCTSEDYTSWTASSSNSAGQKRLTTGNEILCGIKAAKEILIQTDSNLWSMRFIGAPNFFSFTDHGPNGSMRGPNAGITVNGITYWMGEKNFYAYDGRVNILSCDVWPTVFDNDDAAQPGINFVQRAKTYAAYNLLFGEIWWLYCSEAASEIDRYVIFKPAADGHPANWSFGTIVRTAMVGDSDIFLVPFATGSDGYLYDHETGTDDNTSAMTAYLYSGDVEIGDGDYLMQLGAMVPDFKTLTGSIALTVTAKKYPQDSDSQSESSITITSATKYVNPRVKGRQMTLKFTSSALSDHWRMGTPLRYAAKPHGKK